MTEQTSSPATPVFFAEPAEWRRWLERHHDTAMELWVGFHRKATGRPSMTWPEAVDQALSFGWIDGVRRAVDGESYTNRFTPRRPRSTWSAVNIRRARGLIEAGVMHPAGLAAFEARGDDRSAISSYEQRRNPEFDRAQRATFESNLAAWAWFESRPPSYRRAATWWVISAKRDETKAKRLARLIQDSERGETVPPLTPSRGRPTPPDQQEGRTHRDQPGSRPRSRLDGSHVP
jgi:uncharacterized protein YdeI (YjbR/CyaY-like superfamily)